jgi:hypothetical protein
MKDTSQRIEVIWEAESASDAPERLLAAFEMLFKGIPLDLPEDRPS